MRKWKTAPGSAGSSGRYGVAPDDSQAWGDISNMWSTGLGSYAVANPYSDGSVIAATGETVATLLYAFAAATPSGSRSYVVGQKIWEAALGGVSLTDRTNAMTIGTYPMMAEYGTATICAMGNTVATIVSTGGNFSALSGAPKAEILATQSNALLYFNGDGGTLYTDGWWATDVGDYTNLTTGEAANGRFIQTPGPVLAAAAFREYIYAFKSGSIYRGRYVGGVIKWEWEVICWHLGVARMASAKYAVAVCKDGIAFVSNYGASGSDTKIHFFDGVRPPVLLNPETRLESTDTPILTYDPFRDVLVVSGGGNQGITQNFFNFQDGSWGKAVTTSRCVYVMGNQNEVATHYASVYTTRPPRWKAGTDTLRLGVETTAQQASTTGYVETMKVGRSDRKTRFSRVIPILRTRSNLSGGTPSMALAYSMFTDVQDTSAASTGSASESSARDRFDFQAADTAATFRVTFTDMYAEIDDLQIISADAGAE